jgi:hypothetical protein
LSRQLISFEPAIAPLNAMRTPIKAIVTPKSLWPTVAPSSLLVPVSHALQASLASFLARSNKLLKTHFRRLFE